MRTGPMIEIVLYISLIVFLSRPLGRYMADVFTGEGRNGLSWLLLPFENFIYRICGIDKDSAMDWKTYNACVLVFNFFGFLALFLIQIFQSYLPLNPQKFADLPWDLALNTAVSFTTNTNWQSYSGEAVMSYFTQLFGLTVQNFLSAATGIAVLLAFARGLAAKSETGRPGLGNFWVDMTRSVLYVLLPFSLVCAIIFAGQGVVQNISPYIPASTVESGETQFIPGGPAASQVAIKQIGSNGGGFFGTNGAHPFENPTPLTNFIQLLLILLFPAAIVHLYGYLTGARKHSDAVFAAMMIIFVLFLAASLFSELSFNPVVNAAAPMEGKETRFGPESSVLWSVATTAASNGSVNCMHESLSPISGMVALLNIALGGVIFGGVGAGMYTMLLLVIMSVFIAGLMIGRTPEYLGKKIEAYEIKLVTLAILAPAVITLLFSAAAVAYSGGAGQISSPGPHGLSEILYAFVSAAGNNGSAFAGLKSDTVFYNILLAVAMLIGRFCVITPVLAIAGSMAPKKITPFSAGTFPVDGFSFICLLCSVILIMGALTFFPALTLGPVAEHFLMRSGVAF